MKRANGKDLPKAREKDLVTRQIPGELLVYDLKRHKAFCLNETAAAVWKGCNGQRDVAELARLLADDRQSPVDEKVIWLALDQLQKSNLLRQKFSRPAGLPQISRRDLIRIGVVTAIFGQALVFGSIDVALYGAAVWLFFHLAVVFIEEPHLRKERGAAYDEYCRRVPRWFIRP